MTSPQKPSRALCVAYLALGCFSLTALFSQSAFAQDAQLSGRVLDPQGAIIRGAHIVLTQQQTRFERNVTTNADGQFVAPSLPVGAYIVVASAPGFSKAKEDNVLLQTGQAVQITFTLQIGATSQTVNVAATDEQMQTQSSAVQTVIDRTFAATLPLNGRSFDTLFLLTPGVTPSPTDNQGSYSVNGQRTEGNQYYIDGVSANVAGSNTAAIRSGGVFGLGGTSSTGGTNALLSTDALEELQVQTATYAPEYGRTPGGQFSMTSRSGTNGFHGDAFEYLRNNALDANNWINNSLAIPRQPERQNDFGGVLGGPIARNRTFFFFSYEGLRLVQPETTVTEVPSASLRAASVSAIQPLLNLFPQSNGPELSTTGAPLTNCGAPANCIPSGFSQLASVSSNPNRIDSTSLRIDHQYSDRLRFFARYDHAPNSGTNPNGLSPQARQYQLETFTAGATDIIRPNITNSLRYNYSQSSALTHELLPTGVNIPDSAFSTYEPGLNFSNGYVQTVLSFNDQFTYVVWGTNSSNHQSQWNAVDSLTAVVGTHELGFGADYRMLTSNDFGKPKLVGFTETSESDLMSGILSSTLLLNSAGNTFRFPAIGLYAEDTWRIHPNLVLTYGARWDYGGAPDFIAGPQPLAVTGFDNPATLAIAPSGTSLYNPQKTNVAPRGGLAYSLQTQSNWGTVLRAGFGIYYDVQGSAQNTLNLGDQSYSISRGLAFPLTAAEAQFPPLATTTGIEQSVTVVNPNLKSPRTDQWSFALQQQMGPADSLTATYIGSVGHDLLRELQVPNVNSVFQGVTQELTNLSSSSYEALQVKYNRRLSHGLQVLASYSWAHSIDNASTYEYENGPIPNYNPAQDRGSSDFDIRHTFSFGAHYGTPLLHGANAFVRSIVNGWSVDPFVFIQSAPPVDLYISTNVAGFSETLRPDSVPGQPLTISDPDAPRGFSLNPAAVYDFTANYTSTTPLSAVRQGTLGRNVFRGYGLVEPDVSLARRFTLRENLHLNARADAFNFTNHANFAQPNAQVNAPFFGISQTTVIGNSANTFGNLIPLYHSGGPRSLQVSLKLEF